LAIAKPQLFSFPGCGIPNRVPLAVIVDPESNLQNQRATNIIRIVTVYPYNKK